MFSAGILLFEMVFGYAPFYPPSACTHEDLEFPYRCQASPQVQDLLTRLMEREPSKRMTASQSLGHPWITMGAACRSAPSSPVLAPPPAPMSARW
jgi:serine/threonine protein kinase